MPQNRINPQAITLPTIICGTLCLLVSIPAPADDEGQSWSLPAVTVTGRVLTEPGGAGVPDATVVVQTGIGYGIEPVTDASGTYRFTLAAGECSRYAVSLWIDEGCYPPGERSPSVSVRANHENVRAPDLFLKLPQRISGTIRDASTGEPIPGANMECSQHFGVTTDKNGRYCYYVHPGEYQIRCEGTPDRYYPPGFPQTWYGTERIAKVAPVENVDDVDFALESGPALEGTVRDAQGRPVPNARVWGFLEWPPDPTRSSSIWLAEVSFNTRTDSAGGFLTYFRIPARYQERPERSESLEEGGIRLTETSLRRQDVVTFTVMAWSEDGSLAAWLEEERSVWEPAKGPLKLALDQSAQIRLRLVDHRDLPIEKAHIDIWDASRSIWSLERQFDVEATEDGRYQISGVPPGFPLGLEVWLGYNHLFRPVPAIEPGAEIDLGTVVVPRVESFSLDEILASISHPTNDGSERRSHAVRDLSLARLSDEEVTRAVPVLLNQLYDTSETDMPIYVVRALGRMGPAARAAVPVLTERLLNAGYTHRWEVADALGGIGGPEAVAALKQALRDPNTRVRENARKALENLTAKPGSQ
jgi:hypothetical protein